jgi:hypothetical protein
LVWVLAVMLLAAAVVLLGAQVLAVQEVLVVEV